MKRGVFITRGALVGFAVCFAASIAAYVLLWLTIQDLGTERITRRQEVNATLLITCKRENQLSKPSRKLFAFVLTFPVGNTGEDKAFRAALTKAVAGLAPIDCRKLPVFK